MPRTIAGREFDWRIDSVASKANAVVRVSHSSSRANRVIVDRLLVIDQASMMPGPDLADLIALPETHDAKVRSQMGNQPRPGPVAPLSGARPARTARTAFLD